MVHDLESQFAIPSIHLNKMPGILMSNQIPHQSKVLTTNRTMLLKDYPRRYPSERHFPKPFRVYYASHSALRAIISRFIALP